MNIIKNLFKRFKGACDHKFDLKDIMNLEEEPKCKKCGKTLTELNALDPNTPITVI